MVVISTLLTAWFGTSIAGFSILKIVSWLKWILIAVVVGAVGYFGLSTYNSYTKMSKTIKEQQATINNQKGTITSLGATNEELNKTLSLQTKSADITSTVVGELGEKNLKDNNTFSNIQKDRKEREARITKNPVKKVVVKDKATGTEKTVEKALSTEEVTEQISQIRIDAIWASYCSSNKPLDSAAETCSSLTVT